MSSASDVSKACAGVTCGLRSPGSAGRDRRYPICPAQCSHRRRSPALHSLRLFHRFHKAASRRESQLRSATPEFHERLDVAPVKSTAIFNGAFAEILTYNIPLLDYAKKRVGYWRDPDWHIDFTTMDDTAAFTAAAALMPPLLRALHIASWHMKAAR